MKDKKKKVSDEDMKAKLKAEKEAEKQAKKEAEKEEILQNVHQTKGLLQFIDQQGEIGSLNEAKQIVFSDTDDPDKKYEIYYKEIEGLLKQVLDPKADKQTKKAFKILREEKNIFITGKRKNEKGVRGRDVRMSLIPAMEAAANIINENLFSGGNPLQLYYAFRDKNIELGYYNDLKDRKSFTVEKDEHLRDVIAGLSKKQDGKQDEKSEEPNV